MPLISVIIPTYNRPKLLRRAIESVLAQTFDQFEAVIIDDGSTPAVEVIVDEYKDERLRYKFQKNSGLSQARNNGIFEAKSSSIAFLDDDDEFLPNKLAIQSAILENNPKLGMVLGGYYLVNEEGNLLSEGKPWITTDPNDINTWLFGCPTVPSVPLIRKSWLELVGGFDPLVKFVEDVDLWLRLSYAGCPMVFAETIISKYYIHPGGMSRNARLMRDGRIRAIEKFYMQNDLSNKIMNLKGLASANAYLIGAMIEYSSQDYLTGKKDLVSAIEFSSEIIENPTHFLKVVKNSATNPLFTNDPISFTHEVFENLPPEGANLKYYERKSLTDISKQLLFENYEKKEWHKVFYFMRQLFRYGGIKCMKPWVVKMFLHGLFSQIRFAKI